MLCHQVLKELVVQNGTIVDRYMVKEVIERQTAGIKSEAVRDDGNFSSMFSAQSVIG
jgi:hypothetical protein